MAAGDALLAEYRLREAALTYFDIVNIYPDSPVSEAVDTVMKALAWDAERHSIDVAELQRFTDALPEYAECSSDKAVYWIAATHQITGHALHHQGNDCEARPYLEVGRDIARAAMTDMPDSIYQLFVRVVNHAFVSCVLDLHLVYMIQYTRFHEAHTKNETVVGAHGGY